MHIFLIAQTQSSQSLLPFLLVMVVFVVVMNLTQRRRLRRQQQLQSSIEIGDRVQTIGGIMGKVISTDEDSVVLEVETGKIRFAKRAISSKKNQAS